MIAILLVSLGCSKGGDDSGSDGGGPPPEVAGNYTMFVVGTNGCDGVSDWIVGWADGPLVVTGTPDALSFDFGNGVVIPGSVNSASSYVFSGTTLYNEADLAISNGGTFLQGDVGWEAEGYFEVEVDEDENFEEDNCTISGTSRAVEVVGLE